MKLKAFILFLLYNTFFYAQDTIFSIQQLSINQHIDGTLLLLNEKDKPNLIIIIAESGPTDRNGN